MRSAVVTPGRLCTWARSHWWLSEVSVSWTRKRSLARRMSSLVRPRRVRAAVERKRSRSAGGDQAVADGALELLEDELAGDAELGGEVGPLDEALGGVVALAAFD
jgi:hypothetical protein